MIICICNRVSDRDLARHARDGKSFDAIQMETGVATRCGQCEGCARDVVAQGCTASERLNFDGRQASNRFVNSGLRSLEWHTSQHSAQA